MTLDRYLVKQFIPVFLAALGMFVLLLSLIDLFTNLWRYLAYEASAVAIAQVGFYYIPKCISYSLPVALLFASAYALGELYARNELTVVFTSGISLVRFTVPIVIIGIALSFLSFYFEDRLVIPTYRMKMELGRTLLRQQRSKNNSDVVVKADGGMLVYAVDYYNDNDRSLNGLTLIERDEGGRFLSLIRARKAVWNETHWSLEGAISYRWENETLISNPLDPTHIYNEDPEIFKRNTVEVDELSASDAALFIADLRAAGLPYSGALADYYKRFAFAATSAVVLILSISLGGRFQKNILLMSLLSSLIAAVIYYVTQMISMMMAKLGMINPLGGAWAPVVLFIIIGFFLIRLART